MRMIRTSSQYRNGSVSPTRWRKSDLAENVSQFRGYWTPFVESEVSTVYWIQSVNGLVHRAYALPDEDDRECEMCDDRAVAFCGNDYCEYHHDDYCHGDC